MAKKEKDKQTNNSTKPHLPISIKIIVQKTQHRKLKAKQHETNQ